MSLDEPYSQRKNDPWEGFKDEQGRLQINHPAAPWANPPERIRFYEVHEAVNPHVVVAGFLGEGDWLSTEVTSTQLAYEQTDLPDYFEYPHSTGDHEGEPFIEGDLANRLLSICELLGYVRFEE